MKQCSTCKIEKTLTSFYKNKALISGYSNQCIECKTERRKNNKDKRVLESITYRSKNSEKIKDYNNTDIRKEQYRLYNNNRRALKLSTSDNTITNKNLEELLFLQLNKCSDCGCNVEHRESRHLDHIIPLSKGGPHSIHNVQWLCIKCNLTKSDNIYE